MGVGKNGIGCMQWGQALGVGMAVCIQYPRPIPPIMTPNAFTLSHTFVYTQCPYVTSSNYTLAHTVLPQPQLIPTLSTTFPMPSIYTQCRHLLLYLMPTPFSLPNQYLTPFHTQYPYSFLQPNVCTFSHTQCHAFPAPNGYTFSYMKMSIPGSDPY